MSIRPILSYETSKMGVGIERFVVGPVWWDHGFAIAAGRISMYRIQITPVPWDAGVISVPEPSAGVRVLIGAMGRAGLAAMKVGA